MSISPVTAHVKSGSSLSTHHNPMGPVQFNDTASADKIYKFIVGVDDGTPKLVTSEEASQLLRDPFAELILKKEKFPLTAREVINEFNGTKQDQNGLDRLDSFVIAEGGQIQWNESTKAMRREARFAFAIQIKGGIGPDALITTSTLVDSKKEFLQLMSWDPVNGAYNFYQRLNVFWIWSGNSFYAIDEKSRGKGPFSGHINGGPLMKELKIPWQHWNSMNAVIQKEAFAPNDPLQNSSFFADKKGGEKFEQFVRSGIHHWNASRIQKVLNSDVITIMPLMRQIVVLRQM